MREHAARRARSDNHEVECGFHDALPEARRWLAHAAVIIYNLAYSWVISFDAKKLGPNPHNPRRAPRLLLQGIRGRRPRQSTQPALRRGELSAAAARGHAGGHRASADARHRCDQRRRARAAAHLALLFTATFRHRIPRL